MTGPVNLHFMPHYSRSLWWRRLHPLRHCLPSSPHTGQNYFLGTGLSSCALMGEKVWRKCATNQGGGGWNKGETLNMCESSSGCMCMVTRRVARPNCRSVRHCRHPRESMGMRTLMLPQRGGGMDERWPKTKKCLKKSKHKTKQTKQCFKHKNDKALLVSHCSTFC